MDFKVGLLKRWLCAAAASVFKPTVGVASTANGKVQDARPADSFHASGDEGKSNSVKIGWPLPLPMKPTDIRSTSACATAPLEDVTSTPAHHHLTPGSTSIYYPQVWRRD